MITKILIVDDHQIMRNGLRALLRNEPNCVVIGEAGDGMSAVRKIADLSPDVVIMDVRLPDLDGIEATRQAVAAKPDVKIIALSANSDERSVADMLRAGAKGYVLKSQAYEELVGAINAVAGNAVYLSPSITGMVVDDYVNGNTSGGRTSTSTLSRREREVLQLIAEGKATKEVAIQLKVSVKTAETHRRNVMEKLNMQSVAELTKYAIREGITSL